MDHSYSYQPLLSNQHIRYLKLQPAESASDPLTCTLESSPLESCPPFEAISYVWGSGSREAQILCDEIILPITANLDAALHRVRFQTGERTLWVDSICINQENAGERGQQVTLMGDIYRAAKRVLICLGPDSGNHGRGAASLVEEIHVQNQERLTELGRPSLHEDPSVWRFLPEVDASDPLAKDSRWADYSALLSRPWFSRLWTVQEAALGTDPLMIWEDTEIPWQALTSVNLWLVMRARLIWYYTKPWLNDVHLRFFWLPHLKLPTFIEVLARAKTLGCTDKRDRIYAFLGSSKAKMGEDGSLVVTPTYNKDFREVYLDFARTWLQKGGGLGLLSAVEHLPETFEDATPTWVPRWDVELTNNYFGLYNQGFCAGQGLASFPLSFVTERKLSVHGIIFDRVEWRSEIIPEDVSDEKEPVVGSSDPLSTNGNRIRAAWAHLSAADTRFGYKDRSRLLAFARTLCRQAYETETAKFHPDEAAFALSICPDTSTTADLDLVGLHRVAEGGDIKAFNSHAGIWASRRRLVLTTSGRYALSSQMTETGDICCIVSGMDVPVVLRPLAEANSYQLVGEAFVFGMMHGEIKNCMEQNGLDMVPLTIC